MRIFAFFTLLISVFAGCGDFGDLGPPLGVTPGGAQDINYARSLIADGQVPPADSITVEGLLSQHDLPTVGEPCDGLLCARPAVGVAPSLETGNQAYWVQLGMVSGLPADTYRRPPVDLVVLVDRSAAMSVDMDETREAVVSIVTQLREDDRLAVLAFNDAVEEVQAFGSVRAERADLIARIRRIHARGGADMGRGLTRAFDTLREVGADPARMRRVILLSCGYPNVGETHSDAFSRMVQGAAAEGIGLSFFGVLLGFDYQLADLMSQEHGGSYHYLIGLEETRTAFDEELDLMLSPVAYDLRFGLAVSDGFEVDRVFGIPGDDEGEPATELEVATAFMSKRRGAVLVRLRRVPGTSENAPIGTVSLDYRPETAHGMPASAEPPVEIAYTGTRLPVDGSHFDGEGVRKGVALANQAERMIAACGEFHAGDRVAARAIVDELTAYLAAEADALDDDGLRAEAELVAALRANMD